MTQPLTILTPGATLSIAACNAILSAAYVHAQEIDVRVSIAILDAGGNLLGFLRMDDIHAGTAEVSIAKAKCAAMFKRSTRTFMEAYASGATGITALPGVLPFAGGLPIVIDGRLLGSVGCSGASPDQDEAVAKAGIDALSPSSGVSA